VVDGVFIALVSASDTMLLRAPPATLPGAGPA